MPVDGKEQIDMDERKILTELQRNAKVSRYKIAEQCVFFQIEDIRDYRKIGGKQNNLGI